MGTIYTPFGGVPYPDGDSAADIPAIISAALNVIDPKLRGVAYSTTDRDSKFFYAPAGFVCTVVYPPSPTEPTHPDEFIGMYVKTVKSGQVGWAALYEPSTAYTEELITIVDGYEQRAVGYTPVATRENAYYANLYGGIVRSDAGNITNGSVLGYLPSDLLPARNLDLPMATNSNSTSTYLCPKVSIHTDGEISVYGPGNMLWVSFDGVRYRTQ